MAHDEFMPGLAVRAAVRLYAVASGTTLIFSAFVRRMWIYAAKSTTKGWFSIGICRLKDHIVTTNDGFGERGPGFESMLVSTSPLTGQSNTAVLN